MFSRDHILNLASENQKTITAAVRLLAEMQRRGGPVSQTQVAEVAQITSLVFEDIKPRLAQYFPLRGGRFHFPEEVAKPDPWDVEDPKAKQAERAFDALRAQHQRSEATDPRTKLILRLQKLASCEFKAAERQYFFLARSHSVDRIEAAVQRAEARSPAPAEPFGFILALLKSGSPIAGGTARPRQPTTVFAFVKPANAEAAKATIIGWEAATKFAPDGSAIWPSGARRLIWRLRTGHTQYTPPRADEVPPSHLEDPGIMVR